LHNGAALAGVAPGEGEHKAFRRFRDGQAATQAMMFNVVQQPQLSTLPRWPGRHSGQPPLRPAKTALPETIDQDQSLFPVPSPTTRDEFDLDPLPLPAWMPISFTPSKAASRTASATSCHVDSPDNRGKVFLHPFCSNGTKHIDRRL
jgi:hypothetical protein